MSECGIAHPEKRDYLVAIPDEFDAAVAVARRLNFRIAAIELGISRSALSRTVAALENRIGVRLFNRTTRSVSLTESGRQLLDTVGPALDSIHAAVAAAGALGKAPSGTLRINTTASAARQCLPLVLAFLSRHPEMQVDLVTDGQLVDIVRYGFDAGMRIAELVPQDMIRIPLGGDLEPVVVASPTYLARIAAPITPHELRHHICIRTRMPSGLVWRWEFERMGTNLALDVAGPLTLDETTLMIAAAQAGTGLAYVTRGDVAPQLADGSLVQVLGDWTPPYAGLCLYYPKIRMLPAGLRAFVDLICERRSAGVRPHDP